jgi:hypothetical protein
LKFCDDLSIDPFTKECESKIEADSRENSDFEEIDEFEGDQCDSLTVGFRRQSQR